MVEFFLKLGTINRKLILPLFASILYIVMDLIEYFSNMSALHFSLDAYSRGISYSAIIIIPIIQNGFSKKKQTKEEKEKEEKEEKEKEKEKEVKEKEVKEKEEKEKEEKFQLNKRTLLHFSLLYLNYIIFFAVYTYLYILKSDDPDNTEDYRLSHYYGLCSEEALEIIFIVIISKFLLKTKIYIHHYISLALFIILSLCIDIPFNSSLFKPGILFSFLYGLYLLLDSLFITYEKYMMDKLYYSPYIIIFSIGLLFLFASTVSVIVIYISGGLIYDGNKYKIPMFSDYFKEVDYKEVIIHIFYKTGFRFVVNVLKILTIYYLTQYHIYTAYILIKVFDLLLKKDNNYKYISIILFVLEFISLLIYLEIIELNFFNLNKNTKRNIEKREIKDSEGLLNVDNESNLIEVGTGYFISNEMINVSE